MRGSQAAGGLSCLSRSGAIIFRVSGGGCGVVVKSVFPQTWSAVGRLLHRVPCLSSVYVQYVRVCDESIFSAVVVCFAGCWS